MIGDMLWPLELKFRRVYCWLVGHDRRSGEPMNYEPAWCVRCLVEHPEDLCALPCLLSRAYAWMVERDWAWFNRLDMWLIEHHDKRLPSWWKY